MSESSVLDHLIPPEIKGDRFYQAILRVAATNGVGQILEIGSSSGAGSTEAWVAGALKNPNRPTLHCLEISVTRHAALAHRWQSYPWVRTYNLSSVPLEALPSPEEVAAFYREERSRLRRTPLATVLGWLEADRDYMRREGMSGHGIREIKAAHGIDAFDAVLIDGSEFTGGAELAEVYGARFLLLDDTRTFKNWHNSRRLEADPTYRLVRKSRWTRNGFAIFERRR